MALDTVQDYVNAARTLLQDKVEAFRYEDQDFLDALNFGLLESRRLRPDLFLNVATVPSYSTNDTTAVAFDQQYRTALLYYIAGHVQLQDEEDTQDSRASIFLQKFNSTLVGG